MEANEFGEIDGGRAEKKEDKEPIQSSFTSATPSRASMISSSDSMNPGAAVSAAFCRLRSASARSAEVEEAKSTADVPSPPMAVERRAKTSPGVRGWRGSCWAPPPGGGSMLARSKGERRKKGLSSEVNWSKAEERRGEE